MDDTKLSLIDHLEELRKRIFIELVALVVMYIPGYLLAKPAIELLKRYACPPEATLYYSKPMSLFFTELTVGLVFAILFASPVLAFQTWKFVAPALFNREKIAIKRTAGCSCGLFIFGNVFAAVVVIPALMRFSYGMATKDIQPILHVDEVVYLAVLLMLGFGVMFQLPIVVAFLILAGIVSIDSIRKARPYFVLVIFVLSAVLTPPDIVSQLAMAIPSWLFFEISLIFVQMTMKKKKLETPEEESEETESEEAAPLGVSPTSVSPAPQAYPDSDSPSAPASQLSSAMPHAQESQEYPEPPDVEEEDYYDGYTPYEEPEADNNPEKQVRIRNFTPAKHFRKRKRA